MTRKAEQKEIEKDYICSGGSLDCCSKEKIEENKKKYLICSICNNTGYLVPRKFNVDYQKGITETNSKWKQAVEKLKDKYIPMPASDFVDFADKIFGELTNQSQQSSSPVANTDEAQVVGAVGSNPTADTQSPNKFQGAKK